MCERLFVATMVSRGLGITMAIWGLDRVPGALIASVWLKSAFKIDGRALDLARTYTAFSWRHTILLVPSVLSEGVFTRVLCCLAPCHVSCRWCWSLLRVVLGTFHHRVTHQFLMPSAQDKWCLSGVRTFTSICLRVWWELSAVKVAQLLSSHTCWFWNHRLFYANTGHN